MAQISIIKKSDITQAERFDAEYFKPEYLDIDKKLKKTGYFLLKNISKNHNNLRIPIKKELRVSGDYPYYGAQGVGSYVDNYIFDGNYLLVAEDGENLRSRNNDIAFSVNGKFWVNNHAHILSFDNFRIEQLVRNYLNISSLRFISGVAQPKLSKENLDNIKIPKNLFNDKLQLEIEKIVKEAHQKQNQSKQLYQQAEQILLTELGLVDYQPKHQLSFNVNKTEIEQAQRFDAEYFQPKYNDIIEKIESYSGGFDIVKNVLDFNKINFFPEKNKFYKYIPLSRVLNSGEIKIPKEELGKNLPTRARRKVKTGDVILSSISGSLETSAIVEKEHENFIVSNGFYVFNSRKINSETLLILFKSKIMLELLQRISKGAILGGYDLTAFEKLKIPLINQNIQNQIAEKITLSHTLRKQSKDLLALAKTKVEQEIEK